jgi:hypothetical protein
MAYLYITEGFSFMEVKIILFRKLKLFSDPGSDIFPSGSRIQGKKFPDPHKRIEVF